MAPSPSDNVGRRNGLATPLTLTLRGKTQLCSNLKGRVFEILYCKTIAQVKERVQLELRTLDQHKDLSASLVDDY